MLGDFNAHVGSMPCGRTFLDTLNLPGHTMLHARFTSCAATVDPRGHSLNRFVENNSLLMLNGRCSSDRLGRATY